MKSPEPGIYYDIPAHDYHSWSDAISASYINKLIMKSPFSAVQTLKYGDNSMEDRRELIFGTAVHSLILEPNKVDNDKLNEILTEKELFMAGLMRSSANRSPFLSKILKHENTKTEVTIIWNEIVKLGDNRTLDIKCKCRPDILNIEIGIAVDLKTTYSVSDEDVRRTIAKYGYHRSAAHYLAGLKAVGIKIDPYDYYFFFIEKDGYAECAPKKLEGRAISIGERDRKIALEVHATCALDKYLPTMEDTGIILTGLPAWEYKKERLNAPIT